LKTRCSYPSRSFKLVIVDGFSGAGKYDDGGYGSPIIFLNTLKEVVAEINTIRFQNNLVAIKLECYLYVNDLDKGAIDLLRENIQPHSIQANETPNLEVRVEYFNYEFEKLYPNLKQKILKTKCNNVFFNLDQCGYSLVTTPTIRDIMSSWKSAEVILTFMIGSMLAYLSQDSSKNVSVVGTTLA
jgi:three-Cys-motif partner protein